MKRILLALAIGMGIYTAATATTTNYAGPAKHDSLAKDTVPKKGHYQEKGFAACEYAGGAKAIAHFMETIEYKQKKPVSNNRFLFAANNMKSDSCLGNYRGAYGV